MPGYRMSLNQITHHCVCSIVGQFPVANFRVLVMQTCFRLPAMIYWPHVTWSFSGNSKDKASSFASQFTNLVWIKLCSSLAASLCVSSGWLFRLLLQQLKFQPPATQHIAVDGNMVFRARIPFAIFGGGDARHLDHA